MPKLQPKVLYLTQAGAIAAIYVVLSLFAQGFNLASGAIQCRFSEVLTILPFFTTAAVPGLIIGCFLSNIFIGSPLLDIIFGTLATALGAIGTRCLRKHMLLCTFPPVISNALIIPVVLRYGYGITQFYFYLMLTVGAGQIIMCVFAGGIILRGLYPARYQIFNDTHQASKI